MATLSKFYELEEEIEEKLSRHIDLQKGAMFVFSSIAGFAIAEIGSMAFRTRAHWEKTTPEHLIVGLTLMLVPHPFIQGAGFGIFAHDVPDTVVQFSSLNHAHSDFNIFPCFKSDIDVAVESLDRDEKVVLIVNEQ